MASCPSARASRKALDAEGIIFVGPPANAIAAMGDKIESKKLAKEAGVNVVPGYMSARSTTPSRRCDRQRHRLSGDDQGVRRRRRQGYAPRLNEKEACAKAFEATKREGLRPSATTASSSRSSSRSPRHIEIQVLGDSTATTST
jgi:propionyl-CoA carboxylase alpha chain